MSNKKISDSAKLRFCYGIIYLIIFFLLIVLDVCCVWLAAIENSIFAFPALVLPFLGYMTIYSAVSNFIKAGKYMAKDEEKQ